MDPFSVLGLDPGASQAEVKRAYRRLAKALHPDAAGEGALPRFLELQDAYERLTGTKVRTVRASGPARGSGSGSGASRGSGAASESAAAGADGFREPWRADPARARAAREQARARRPWPGTTPGWASDPASGPARAAGTTEGRDAGARRSAPGPRTASGPAAGGDSDTSTASRSTDGQARPGARRRAARKATLGSTSYDEAREPTDRHWAGASWYGPTTGEYWIVNPREYADPRKHGPGYSGRGRVGQSASGSVETERPSQTGRPGETPRPADTRRPVDPSPPVDASPSVDGSPPGETAPPAEATAEGSGSLPGASAAGGPAQSDPRAAPTAGGATRRSAGQDLLVGRVLGGSATLPAGEWRRLGLVLLAWPPLGLAAATAIGQATGCLSYSVSCSSADRLLPWLAQALIVGLLLASPWLARLLGAGTVAAVVALVPGVGILTALGGASSAESGPVLAGWLALAWVAGVGLAARRALLSPTAAPDDEP